MKNLLGILIISILSAFSVNSQCSVVSTNGYTVTIKLKAKSLSIVNNGGGCTYKVNIEYDVKFTGTNIPSGLYTLQGDIRCNNTRIFFDLPNNGGVGTVQSSNASFNGNCTGLTVNNLCDEFRVQIHGPSLSDRTIICGSVGSASPLPIDLLSFTGEQSSTGVELNWSTASERNNAYYTIERSTDAKNFEVIETIPGNGTSTVQIDYTFEDKQAIAGVNYYRLSQTDYNGMSETFDIIAVTKNSKSEISSHLFPNPTQNGLVTILVNAEKEAQLMYSVYSLEGRLIETRIFTESTVEISLPAEKTSYFIQVTSNNEVIGRHRVISN